MADDFAAIARDAMASVPTDLKARVTFTRTTPTVDSLGAITGTTTTTIVGTAVGVPASQADLDEYAALGLVRSSARTLIFVPETAGESPLEGDTIPWAGDGYTVKSVGPTQPGGVTLAARVVIGR